MTMRTVKFENENNVAMVSDSNPFAMPSGLKTTFGDVKIKGNTLSPTPTPTPVPTPQPTVPDAKNVMNIGDQLNPNDRLESLNGEYRLYFQGDGNLVLRRMSDGSALWSTGTHNKGAIRLTLQGDGNLVMYSDTGAIWASGTVGKGVTKLVLKDYGVIKLEKADGADVWIRPEGVEPTPVPTVEPTPVPTVEPTPVPTVEPTPVPTPSTSNNTLNTEQKLLKNQYIESPNGSYRLYFQGDGNLVMRFSGKAIWSTGTHGKGGEYVKLQGDGNLVIRDGGGKALWSSKTNGKNAIKLIITNDGKIKLIKADGASVWVKP